MEKRVPSDVVSNSGVDSSERNDRDIVHADIASKWLSEVLKLGLASVTKTTIEAALVRSYDQAYRERQYERLSDYQLGLKLRVSSQKIKALRYHADLLFAQRHDDEAKFQFLCYLSRASPESIGDRVRLQLANKLAQSWVHDWIESGGGVYDSSFNRDIVDMRIDVLCDLLQSITGNILRDNNWSSVLDKHITELKIARTVEGVRKFVSGIRAIPIIGKAI